MVDLGEKGTLRYINVVAHEKYIEIDWKADNDEGCYEFTQNYRGEWEGHGNGKDPDLSLIYKLFEGFIEKTTFEDVDD